MPDPVSVLILAVPETAGSVLYGMVDVLCATGNIWQTLVRTEELPAQFSVRIVTTRDKSFCCGNGIPVNAHATIEENPAADILILPEMWLGPEQHLKGCYGEVMNFIRQKHAEGSYIYSACSGAVMLAETGLLDGSAATSHWGYQDLFAREYPQVRFEPAPSICFADEAGMVVTAGGTSSWHDLMLHIISRHISPGEAMRIAKVYLLKLHTEGQLPYATLTRNIVHTDGAVLELEESIKVKFREHDLIRQLIRDSGLPERTLKRRFKKATGQTLIEYIQNLRVEEAKHHLETTRTAINDISFEIGYEDPAFFRRLFKRLTGMTPSEYRKVFHHSSMQ
jgi:transcriptional regulator GlxA family with amidase domain